MGNYKAAAVSTGKVSKEERENRINIENKLKGNSDKIKPSKYLTKDQKKLHKFLVSEMEASGILGNVDIFILDKTSITIDRIQKIDAKINENEDNLFNPDLRVLLDKYNKDFHKCLSELPLTPQSRAKLGNLSIDKEKREQSLLMKALHGEDID